jgi:PKD repeat protein
MYATATPTRRRWTSVLAVVALSVAGLVGTTIIAAPLAAADTPTGPGPVLDPPPSVVTADVLPTVQIDGVVWSQQIVGNTVYAAGSFANARPAGAAAGTNQTPRSNLLAYNLQTGALITTFAPNLNAEAKVVTVSPDGSRIYIGGSFTAVNGQQRNRIAAFSTATGALISTFAPNLNATVNAIAATNTTVYVGGVFTTGNGQTRSHLAAYSASDGSLLNWAPTTDLQVDSMVMTPDLTRVIVAGRFNTVNGVTSRGLASLDPVTAALLPWAVVGVVRNSGSLAGIWNLSADSDSVYGSGWGFGTVNNGNLEGAFRVDADSGTIQWVENCHGDTYGAYSDGTTVYTISHAHYCGVVGGFPETNPRYINMRHAIAFTKAVTGIMSHDPYAGGTYADWYGTPSPSMINWFPDFAVGSYTGQDQATWSVTGNGQYVVMGGEFPTVNGAGQQGLVRFAVRPIAPAKQAPRVGGSTWPAGVTSFQPGTVRISFPANYDRDDLTLDYRIVRDGDTNHPIYTTTVDSTFWNRPPLGYLDTGLAPGSTHTYRVYAIDGDGNQNVTSAYTVTVASTDPGPYADEVLNDGAGLYWRLGEPSGTAVLDWAGFNDGVAGSGVTRGTSGAIIGDSNTAATFSGSSSGLVSSQMAIDGPDTFTISAWFRTTTRSGGKIVGFGNAATGNSSSYDRHIYMDNNGRILFGVYTGSVQVLQSGTGLNNGAWHQVVGTLSPAGMTLSIDGKTVASRTDVTSAQDYTGYWRVGGDNLNSWTNKPSSNYFSGAIDDVAIFPTALTRQQIRNQYLAAGYSIPGLPPAPADAYGADVYNHDPDLYWRLSDATGSNTAADSGVYNNAGTATGVAFGQPGALPGVSNNAAQFNGSSSFVVAKNSVANPTVYSESAWFKTTSTSGGRIIGFGNASTGLSTSYDRMVYLTNDGRLIFGANGGGLRTLTTTGTYNDGQWHQVVATQGPDGMKLYVDGTLLVQNAAFTTAQNYTGFWRIGGDNLNAWPNRPTSNFLAGTIDEVAVYSTVLSAAEVAQQYSLATGQQPNSPPTASFTGTLNGMQLSVNGSASSDDQGPLASYAWDFGDGGTASGATAGHTYTAGGAFQVTLTVTDSDGARDSMVKTFLVSDGYTTAINADSPSLSWRLGEGAGAATAVDSSGNANDGGYQGGVAPGSAGSIPGSLAPQFDGSSGVVVAQASVNNPTVYTEEAWFKTTSTAGGKIVGFGNAASGTSSNYDRHVYMDTAGHVNFGVWTGSMNVATSPGSYNDGNWHQVVASQGPDGMKLYLDGQLVASNPQTAAQAYSGYWRVGGDSTWSGAPFFAGQIDNVAIYPTVLSAAAVLQHYGAGTGSNPSASFTKAVTGLSVSVDASGSSAASGRTITGYSWDFGDGGTATGKTATHAYDTGGSYTITLKVTDNVGVVGTSSQQVTVHQSPTAALTATATGLTASADGSASQAFDGASVSSYRWDWGDGSAKQDTTSPTATHTYATPGPYTVTLVVTDSTGAASAPVTKPVTAAHADPVAAFSASMNLSDLSVDASASTASDGATLSYSWNWGDGTPAGSGVTATHHYAAVGQYTVTLTLTDSLGGTATAGKDVTASTHRAPTASFTVTESALSVSANGSGSAAFDGATVSSYHWDWGDGSAVQTTATATANHTYAAAGDYTIALIVTDSLGADSAPSTVPVSVSAAAPPVAADSFTRTVASGWGAADTGGTWTFSTGAANYSVDGTGGLMSLPTAGADRSAYLTSPSVLDVDTSVDITFDKAPTGNGYYAAVGVRRTASSGTDYRAKLHVMANGTVAIGLARFTPGETIMRTVNIAGLTVSAGDTLRLRFAATGTNPTTLSAKVWKVGSAEPADWQNTVTDSTAALQVAGGFRLWAYLSGTSSNFPVVARFDNFVAVPPQ